MDKIWIKNPYYIVGRTPVNHSGDTVVPTLLLGLAQSSEAVGWRNIEFFKKTVDNLSCLVLCSFIEYHSTTEIHTTNTAA